MTLLLIHLCAAIKTSETWPFLVFTGKFKDIYHDYQYTYQGCGILLIVSSFLLFAGMGLNYRLLDKEKKEEERKARVGGREQKSKRDTTAKDVADATDKEDSV